MNYSWLDIQTFVMTLPIERIITVYEGKKAENKSRYLEALCDKNVAQAAKDLNEAEAEFNRRSELAKERRNV